MSREISDIFKCVSDYILRAKYYLSRYHYWRYAKYIEVNFRYNVPFLTDYYQQNGIIPKFYFIVDRIDLMNQAKTGIYYKRINSSYRKFKGRTARKLQAEPGNSQSRRQKRNYSC